MFNKTMCIRPVQNVYGLGFYSLSHDGDIRLEVMKSGVYMITSGKSTKCLYVLFSAI